MQSINRNGLLHGLHLAAATSLAILVLSGVPASAQEQSFNLDGVNFWEAAISGFDPSSGGENEAIRFVVSGSIAEEDRELFSFEARARGEAVVLLLETTGIGTPIETLGIVSGDGSQESVPFGPQQRIQVEVPDAARRWCNPFVGCRFEFWRRRNAAEQSFTFSAPVQVVVDDRRFEAVKLIFESAELESGETPEFSSVRMTTDTSEPVRVLNVVTHMPPMLHDGLFHDLRGDAGSSVERGVFEVVPFSPTDGFHLGIETGDPMSAWQGRLALRTPEDDGEHSLTLLAETRLNDGSSAGIAFLEASLAPTGEGRSLGLAAGFDGDTYRFTALDGEGNIVADLRGLPAGHAVASIANFDCATVPEFFVNCPRFVFKTLPTHGNACAWVLSLSAPRRAEITGADGSAMEVNANQYLLYEDHDADEADHAAPMVFSRIALRGEGFESVGVFDQMTAPADVWQLHAH